MTKSPERLMLDCVKAMLVQETPQAAVDVLLPYLCDVFVCDVAMLLIPSSTGLKVQHAEPAGLQGLTWNGFTLKAERIGDLHIKSSKTPTALKDQKSLVSVPLNLSNGVQGFLVCASVKIDAFTEDHLSWLYDYASYACHAMNQFNLQKTSTFMTSMIRGSSSSFAVADATKKGFPLVYVNKAFEELTGYSAQEVIGENCRFLSAELLNSGVRVELRKTINRFGQGTFLLRNKRKDGSLFWNRLTIHPVFDSDGNPQNIVATQIDLTDQVDAEAERDLVLQRLEDAMESTDQAFLVLDNVGSIAFVNQHFKDFFGLKCRVGSSFASLWRDHLMAIGTDEVTAEHQAKEYLCSLLVRKRSTELILADGRNVLLNERPTSGGGAVIVVTDITQLKSTERRLKQRVAAIDMAQDGITIATQDHRVIYTNPSTVALWSQDHSEDLLGRRWYSQYDLTINPKQRQIIDDSLSRLGLWAGTLIPIASPDTSHEVSISSIPDVGIVLIVRDITERLSHEHERARFEEQITQSQRQAAIGQLAAGIAHDFNNLLSAITGSANLISSEKNVPTVTKIHADRITAAGYQAARIVNKLY